MISNDERREVAARLRNYEKLQESFRESPICAFLDALGVGYIDWKGVCNRLADFIEPEPERTCRNLGGEEGTNYELYDFGCSLCGYCADITDPNYCPHCRAKVVE